MHVVLINLEKVYLSPFEFQFVTVQNGKKSKGGEYLCKALYDLLDLFYLDLFTAGFGTLKILTSFLCKREDCDVAEVLWPDPAQRHDAEAE